MSKPIRGIKVYKSATSMFTVAAFLLVLAFGVAGMIFYSAHSTEHSKHFDHGKMLLRPRVIQKKSKVTVPYIPTRSTRLDSDAKLALNEGENRPIENNITQNSLAINPIHKERSELVMTHTIYSSTIADDVDSVLRNHPIHSLTSQQRAGMSMEDHFVYLKNQSQCRHVPIFTSMANVFSDMYWQLIENFVYTMTKFEVSSCTLMVCVSDPKCMDLCGESHFPCYDFQYKQFHSSEGKLPSALEQIGELKLLHIPKALARGVDVLMLDLDVGFIDDPMKIVTRLDSSKSDIFVQMDITFIMNRTRAGWRTWFTEPLPNIGIMLCRGNAKTVKTFEIAWRDYKSIKIPIKHNPGKDQNKVVNAMRVARHRFGLKWEYIPKESAVLLDKIYKFDLITTYELGGVAAERVLHEKGVFAVHTTCYEQKSKVMGLKAANAFWNPKYYDPFRKTITKQLVYLTDQQLRWEVRALLYLGYVTNRSVIIPNIYGNEIGAEVQLFDGQAMWPGFRTAYFKESFPHRIEVLEPAFYWRVRRDYVKDKHAVPQPTVMSLHELHLRRPNRPASINAIESLLLSKHWRDVPRIVLYSPPTHAQGSPPDAALLKSIVAWAEDSIGRYEAGYDMISRMYGRLPNLGEDRLGGTQTGKLRERAVAERIMTDVRLCSQVMNPNMGNRSCFDKCK